MRRVDNHHDEIDFITDTQFHKKKEFMRKETLAQRYIRMDRLIKSQAKEIGPKKHYIMWDNELNSNIE